MSVPSDKVSIVTYKHRFVIRLNEHGTYLSWDHDNWSTYWSMAKSHAIQFPTYVTAETFVDLTMR